MKKIINDTPNCPKAVGTYSQGVYHCNTYYFSGQIGIDPETGILREKFQDQLDQILNNIDALLKHQNLKREDIIKTTIFLKDLSNFSLVNEAYESFFTVPYPARSCIEASRLPKDSLVEIEVIAGKDNKNAC